jgi:[NiFe] hydrogenase assembly HybE family chaperone
VTARFEGSYLGDDARIADDAILECKICWTPYDPAFGDDARQIEPGTPFRALPKDWRCPVCDGDKAQFMVRDRGTAAPEPASAALIAEGTARLVAAFREIYNGAMRDVPLVNRSLAVEAVGFRPVEGRILGVLLTPWFMNLVLLPGPDDDWSGLVPGAREDVAFPSGVYEFIHGNRPQAGGYKACSLFSPVQEFASQLQAVEVARAVMIAVFDPANREEGALAPARQEPRVSTPATRRRAAADFDRRGFLTGGAARQREAAR